MSERNWKEEQRSVLTRLFDSVFERREASEDQAVGPTNALRPVVNKAKTVRIFLMLMLFQSALPAPSGEL